MCSVQCASVNSVPCTSSEEGGEVVCTLHLLQCYRKQERWVQVCSLCKMGEVVHKCTSVQMCTVCTYCSLEGGGDVGVQVCKGGSV